MITRRRFLKNSMFVTTIATGTTLSVAPHARALGANDDIRVAVVGFRGQGSLHLRMLRELSGVRVVAVCDVDQDVLDRELEQAAGRGEKLVGYTDVRKLFEDKNIGLMACCDLFAHGQIFGPSDARQ